MNRPFLSLAVLALWIVLLPCLTVAVAHCGVAGTCLTVTSGAVLPPVSLLTRILSLCLLVTGTLLVSTTIGSIPPSTFLRFQQNRIPTFSDVPRHLRNEVFLL